MSRSPVSPSLEDQKIPLAFSIGGDHGIFPTSHSSLAGGVVEYVGGNDILTLLRREGIPLSVDPIAVEDVP